VCKIIVALYNYVQVANFFWMLVEGLYLHTMIVWAFSIERIRFWYYAVLGWCQYYLIISFLIKLLIEISCTISLCTSCKTRMLQVIKVSKCT
jgi:hypothetical protein